MEFCFSCGMPLTDESKSKNTRFCKYCADESGAVKTREEVLGGIANWLRMMQPELAEDIAMKRAVYYLKAMPQWADV
jgi:hypothetical protein